MELSIVTYIKTYGLNKAVKDFKLKMKDYGYKILLKYDQIESDMSFQEVQECRGLILEKDTWRVFSLAFKKFFNSAEGHASKIDWNSAKILNKYDGSCMSVYWDWVVEKFFVSTTGMGEGEGEVNNIIESSFADLFWKTIKDVYNLDNNNFNKGYSYVFELMTIENHVVKIHNNPSVTLLTIRDLKTLKELSYEEVRIISEKLSIPHAEAFDLDFKNPYLLAKTLDGLPFDFEGYVVVDGDFNRIKIKNPAYLSAHHLKSSTAEYNIVGIIKTNEIDEYLSIFKDRKDKINELKLKYDEIILKLENIWGELAQFKPKNITKEEQKKYAMKVFEIVEKNDVKNFSGLFFALKDYKVHSVKDYILNLDNKKLYQILSE